MTSNFSLNNLAVGFVGTLLTATPLVISSPVQALTLITDRSQLEANDSLDFSSLGQVFNPLVPPTADSFLPNTFVATSDRGLGLEFNIPPSNNPAISPPLIFQTTPAPDGISTNFADGDFILFTGLDFRFFPAPGNPGPLTIDFETPIIATGTQIAVDDTSSFTAFLSAFDDGGDLLGSFSVPGSSSLALDNSASFLGVTSEAANIARLVYSTSVPNRAIGINAVSIKRKTIPESSTLFGLLVLATSSSSWLFRRPKMF